MAVRFANLPTAAVRCLAGGTGDLVEVGRSVGEADVRVASASGGPAGGSVLLFQDMAVAVLRTAPSRAGGLGTPPPPPRSGLDTEIVPDTDPNALRTARIELPERTSVIIAIRGSGSIVLLVDGVPVDITRQQRDVPSVDGVWVNNAGGDITS